MKRLLIALGLILAGSGVLYGQANTSPYTITICDEKTDCPGTGYVTVLEDADNWDAVRNFFIPTEADYHLFLPGATGSVPATCEPGQIWTDRDAAASAFLNVCTSTDTWTAIGSGGSFTDFDTDYGVETVTSTWTLQNLLNLDSGTEGRLILSASASTPGTCTLGEIYFDSDATAGQNLELCTATDTWTTVSGGGGGTPGGSDTQYQYNNSSAFGGVANFTFNDATGQSTYSDDTAPGLTIEHDAGAATSGIFEALRMRLTTSGDASADLGSCIGWGVTEDTSTDQDLAMICGNTATINETRGEITFRVWDNSLWRDALVIDNSGDVETFVNLRAASGSLEFGDDLKTVGTQDWHFDGTTNTFAFSATPDSANFDFIIAGTSGNSGNLVHMRAPNEEYRFAFTGDDAADAVLNMYDDTGSLSLVLRADTDVTSEFYGPIQLRDTDTPPTCSAGLLGSIYYDTSDDRIKKCDGTVAWVNLEGGAFSPGTIDVDYGAETVTSAWIFQGANTVQTATWGIETLFNFDGATEGRLILAASASRPGTCTIGEIYFDSDETAGENLYGCTATDTWTLLGAAGSGSPGGSDTQVQYNDNASFGGISEFVFDDAATGALTFTADNVSQLPLTLEAYSSSTDTGPREVLRLQAETTAASLGDTYGPKLVFAAYDSGGGQIQGGVQTRRANGSDADSEMLFSVYDAGSENSVMMITADTAGERLVSAWGFGVGSYLAANAACLQVSSDRIYHDTDCDGSKEAGEEWIDAVAGSKSPKEIYFSAAALRGGMDPGDSSPAPTHDEGTNIDIDVLAFSPTTDECAGGSFLVPSDLTATGGDDVTFRAKWYGATATSGNVLWRIEHLPRAEGESWDAALTTEAAAADAVQGTLDQITVTTWTETVTNTGWAASDLVEFLVCRDADAGGDTMTGDAMLIDFAVEVIRE